MKGTATKCPNVHEEAIRKSKREGKLLHRIRGRQANSIGHVLRRNYLLKHTGKDRSDRKTRKKTYAVTGRT